MVCANSGAGGNPDPTFGRCTIFSILHQFGKEKCCECGKGEGREKGLKGACVGGCSPSLWSSPAAVGCSLPCFYKKLLFRTDLLDFFCRYDPSLRCLSLGLAGSSISGAGGRWIHFFLYFSFWCSNLQSPIKAKKTKYHLGKIGCGRQPPPDDYRVLHLWKSKTR